MERIRALRRGFERLLWATRFVMLVPVVFSVLLALAALYLATVEAIYVIGHLSAFTAGGSTASAPSAVMLLAAMIETFDIFLIAATLLIFALGLYELFIHPLETDVGPTHAGRLLIVRSLDDLKDRLAKLVLLVLVVEVLQKALQLPYRTALDVLFLALAAVLVGSALFLSTYWRPRAPEEASDIAERPQAPPPQPQPSEDASGAPRRAR